MIPYLAPNHRGAVPMDGATGAWFDREISGCSLADERLHKRLGKLLRRMTDIKLGAMHGAELVGN